MSAARMAMSVCARRTFAIRALPAAYRMVAAVPRLARPTAQPVMAQAVRSFHYTCRASDDAATPAKPVFLDKEEVLERVMTVVKSFEKIDPTKVSPTAKFKDDLGLDSLDSVEVVMAIEDEFAIVIPDDEADAILSVEDAVVFISSHPNAH
eukprot:TRINITY_DN7477_c0_g1_i1.p1 TRINITY_DN7477_c0_g1~~TRINITY_DN7477_c0_g1_i1.p1  ORF type:complete len:151 (-),score=40.42 TRINITY_DN7477_c0_g1_i1:278-730(-)